jgi:hypothetical protein
LAKNYTAPTLFFSSPSNTSGPVSNSTGTRNWVIAILILVVAGARRLFTAPTMTDWVLFVNDFIDFAASVDLDFLKWMDTVKQDPVVHVAGVAVEDSEGEFYNSNLVYVAQCNVVIYRAYYYSL